MEGVISILKTDNSFGVQRVHKASQIPLLINILLNTLATRVTLADQSCECSV
jgi:hypothetical protein